MYIVTNQYLTTATQNSISVHMLKLVQLYVCMAKFPFSPHTLIIMLHHFFTQ